MILVTGVAGFIDMHVARRLLADGRAVLGVNQQPVLLSDFIDALELCHA
jgi:nucleoside-diphosphate-sugar epimerase